MCPRILTAPLPSYHFTVDTKTRVLEKPNFAINPKTSTDASMSHNCGSSKRGFKLFTS